MDYNIIRHGGLCHEVLIIVIYILSIFPDLHGLRAPEESLNWKSQFPCCPKKHTLSGRYNLLISENISKF